MGLPASEPMTNASSIPPCLSIQWLSPQKSKFTSHDQGNSCPTLDRRHLARDTVPSIMRRTIARWQRCLAHPCSSSLPSIIPSLSSLPCLRPPCSATSWGRVSSKVRTCSNMFQFKELTPSPNFKTQPYFCFRLDVAGTL